MEKNNMNKKQYETIDDALKEFLSYAENLNGQLKTNDYIFYGNRITKIIIEFFINFIENKNILKTLEKISSSTDGEYYYSVYSGSFYDNVFRRGVLLSTDFHTHSRVTAIERLFFKVGDKTLHIFDIVGMTRNDVDLIKDKSKDFFVMGLNELLYEYYILKEDNESAEQILENILDQNIYTIIKSDNPKDFIPYFNIVKKGNFDFKPATIKENIIQYFLAFDFGNHPKDMFFHNKFLKDFRKEILKTEYTKYSFQIETQESIGGVEIKGIDLFESDLTFRRRLLKFSSYDDRNRFAQILRDDRERLEKAILKHLNDFHKNGKYPTAFRSLYTRLKNYDIKIDVFKLDPKLQALALLETLT